MGGSGGGFFYERTKPSNLISKLRKGEDETQDQFHSNEIEELLRSLLTYANDRDYDSIQTHLNEIGKAIASEIDGTIDLRYGGSVSKHTYVDGLSDVDTLAILNNSELADKTPSQVKDYFYEQLRNRFPRTEIKKGDLAITVKFADGCEIQILPSVKTKTGIKIASTTDHSKWSPVINPRKFALSLKYTNQKNSGKVIPIIKIAKSIISKMPEKRRLSGYHVEALAVDIFSSYTGKKDYRSMIKHFFESSATRVLNPIQDSTRQSTNVDQYLGASGSINRKMASDSLNVIYKKMERADSSRLKEVWIDIL
ncbi:CBASS oligonucleotide cyclase [Ekhidna sp.]|uniref:CBASS oligonucleotide cyclase n=1 Tax=Ekhidna sp. TaxID=2608089 RepID=UPI003299D2C1